MCVVVDANVWIDLFCGDLHIRVLELGHSIVAVDVVVSQLKHSPDGQALVNQGLNVQEVDGEGVAQAYDWRSSHPELEVPDVMSLALAKRSGWALATRDGSLRDLAENEKVPVLTTCQVLVLMATNSLISELDILRFKREMSKLGRPFNRAEMKEVERLVKRPLQ